MLISRRVVIITSEMVILVNHYMVNPIQPESPHLSCRVALHGKSLHYGELQFFSDNDILDVERACSFKTFLHTEQLSLQSKKSKYHIGDNVARLVPQIANSFGKYVGISKIEYFSNV